MNIHQPSATMRIVTKIERIQPTVTGRDDHGELIWEGRAMPRWQMEMLKVAVNYFAEFFTRWIEVSKLEARDIEFSPEAEMPTKHRAATKEWIEKTKRIYITKKSYARCRIGD